MQLELASLEVPSPPLPQAAAPAPWPAEKQIEAFVLSAIDNQGTRRAYRGHLLKAFRTMSIDRLEDVTPRHLAALRAAIIGSTLASATQAQALSALRAFLAWSSLDTPLPFSLDAARRLLRLPTVSTNVMPAVLSDEEARRVLELADEASGEQAMVMVLLGAGLRVSELCALDCQDVVTEVHCAILRVHGKGGKQRLVPVHPPVVGAIEGYLAVSHRSLRSEGPLFVTHDPGARARANRRISTRSTRRRITKLLRRAGVVKRVRVHGFRHTYATTALRRGVNVNAVRRLLGHASLATTQRYVDHQEMAELLQVVPDPTAPSGTRR